jgi:hypothetical protein
MPTNLISFLEKATEARDKNRSKDIGYMYMAFSQAFDKVSHQRLIRKMIARNIGAETVNCIENWLTW